ncbi:hypothetical protein [Rhizobium wuzhouense]|uniref:Uncharacterized protein n=1 Tax=Rhizobium wuzhouense TaxID=1986026 RepID=A0ABX5NLX3_9HYPH|nr:hypothetical protein [Rhizobium wuzhouense]PYB70789.1 hypothetical protein DMY87_20195 [Rhizobium wuzhouense]
MRKVLRLAKWLALSFVLLIVVLLIPVGYVETFCTAEPQQETFTPKMTDPAFLRAEANSYLTYPEWHIVYAYEGLANILKTGDEHDFGYTRSVVGFWASFCALNREADRHGGADVATRRTIHVIGVSFTLEMGMKALYEETVGRLFALLRGADKAPQDRYAAVMAEDYGQFLHQTPWYKYNFDGSVTKLWAEPVTSLRSWERRLALGGEWKAKAAYARVIAGAVAATGQAQLTIRSLIAGVPAADLQSIADVTVVEDRGADGILIETPRYRAFTVILQQIAARNGRIVEIAGNDDIMVSALGASVPSQLGFATRIVDINRDGFTGRRMLLQAKVRDLPALFSELGAVGLELEHVYDY